MLEFLMSALRICLRWVEDSIIIKLFFSKYHMKRVEDFFSSNKMAAVGKLSPQYYGVTVVM